MNMFQILVLAVFFSGTALAQNQSETVIPLTTYSRSSDTNTTISISFQRTAMQLDDHHHYTLIIKNADGEAHPIPTAQHCKTLSLLKRLICFSTRSTNLRYLNQSRVKSATISVNGTELINASNFNENTASTEISVLNLAANNTLGITLTGSTTSFIQLSLVADISSYDEVPPSLMASIFPNALTNQKIIHISITDLSDTTTDVYNNGIFILTTPSKSFDVTLSQPCYANCFTFLSHSRKNDLK